MATIVKCSDDVIAQIPNVMEHIYKIFGDKPLIIYAVLSENNIGFIARDYYKCLYIKNEKERYSVTPFQLNENEEVGMIMLGDDHFFFTGEDMYMVDKDGIEHALGIRAINGLDVDDYDGFVYYAQYNKENDTLCDIRYQQMYREVNGKAPIYSYHTQKISVLSIDEQYSKRGNNHKGFVSKHSKYFSKYEFDSEHIGYTLTAMKDYGIFNVVTQGAYALQKEDKVIRYVKALYVQNDGNYFDIWPFAKQIDSDTLNELIRSYGFRTDIPDALMRVYNGYENIVLEIQDLASQMKALGKCDDEQMCMLLQLVPEEDK